MKKIIEVDTQTKSYAVFYSPGTFFSESSQKECEYGNIEAALKLYEQITERYNSKPYAFKFIEYEETKDENGKLLDSRELSQTGCYHINGTIKYLKDYEKDSIPYSNMLSNQNPFVETQNSWKHTTSFEKNDVLLKNGKCHTLGSNPDIEYYRLFLREEYNKVYNVSK